MSVQFESRGKVELGCEGGMRAGRGDKGVEKEGKSVGMCGGK